MASELIEVYKDKVPTDLGIKASADRMIRTTLYSWVWERNRFEQNRNGFPGYYHNTPEGTAYFSCLYWLLDCSQDWLSERMEVLWDGVEAKAGEGGLPASGPTVRLIQTCIQEWIEWVASEPTCAVCGTNPAWPDNVQRYPKLGNLWLCGDHAEVVGRHPSVLAELTAERPEVEA